MSWSAARAQAQRASGVYAILGWLGGALVVVPIAMFADAVSSGPWRYAVMSVSALVLLAPAVYAMWRDTIQQQARSNELAIALERGLTEAIGTAEREAADRLVQVHRQEFETRLANALEMAEDEREVLGAVERALAATLPDRPAELLLADNSHAHLIRMAVATPTGEAPACPVDSPDHCPAARRAQVQQFVDSDAIDACPKLRDRPHGRCSAVCVPVSMMGRTVGVIHATGAPDAVVPESTVADLGTLSKLAGARIGLLRVIAETQLQAATDSLTGLLNRRSLENSLRDVRASKTSVTVAMADLDHFKELNDKHGHETGDRALRLFAQVLRSSLPHDALVARYGGEEFAVVMPASTAEGARAALDRVRIELKDAIGNAGLPHFTASFGILEATEEDEDLARMLAHADVALFDAKHQGRDCIVIHDRDGNPVPEQANTQDTGLTGALDAPLSSTSVANGSGRTR